MTEDEKINDIAVAMIRRKSIDPENWRFTCFGGLHTLLTQKFQPRSGEFVVASAQISPENWYAFITRRLVCCFNGQHGEAVLSKLEQVQFGNFKGYGPKPLQSERVPSEVAIFNFSDGSELKIQYETGKASMAPIYAAKFWQNKTPISDKLTVGDKN
jgi:hypothetical protein